MFFPDDIRSVRKSALRMRYFPLHIRSLFEKSGGNSGFSGPYPFTFWNLAFLNKRLLPYFPEYTRSLIQNLPLSLYWNYKQNQYIYGRNS